MVVLPTPPFMFAVAITYPIFNSSTDAFPMI
jgi:hypothetical protein